MDPTTAQPTVSPDGEATLPVAEAAEVRHEGTHNHGKRWTGTYYNSPPSYLQPTLCIVFIGSTKNSLLDSEMVIVEGLQKDGRVRTRWKKGKKLA